MYAQDNVTPSRPPPSKIDVFFRVFKHENVWKAPIDSSAYQTLAGPRSSEWAVGRLN